MFSMNKKLLLIFTLSLIAIIEYIGNRCFELYRFKAWFPSISFILICFDFCIGYNYWKREDQRWLCHIWMYIYIFILTYFVINWFLFTIGFIDNGFLYKSYLHFGTSPLTFGLVYLISVLSKVKSGN